MCSATRQTRSSSKPADKAGFSKAYPSVSSVQPFCIFSHWDKGVKAFFSNSRPGQRTLPGSAGATAGTGALGEGWQQHSPSQPAQPLTASPALLLPPSTREWPQRAAGEGFWPKPCQWVRAASPQAPQVPALTAALRGTNERPVQTTWQEAAARWGEGSPPRKPTGGHCSELCQWRFNLDIKNNFFTGSVWKELPRDCGGGGGV